MGNDKEDKLNHIIDKIKKPENNHTVVSLRNLINGTYEKAVYSSYLLRSWRSYSKEKKDLKEVIAMIMKTKRNDTDWKNFEIACSKEIKERLPSQWKEQRGGAQKFRMAVRARIANFNHVQSAEQQFEEDLKKARKKIKRMIDGKILNANNDILENKQKPFSEYEIAEVEKRLKIKTSEKEWLKVKNTMKSATKNKDEIENIKRYKDNKIALFGLRGEIMVKLPPELLPGEKSFLEQCKSGCFNHSEQILEGEKLEEEKTDDIQGEIIKDAEDCKIKCLETKKCEGINYYHHGEKNSDKKYHCDMIYKIKGRKNVNFEKSSFVQAFLKMEMMGNKKETLTEWYVQATQKHKKLLQE